MLISRTKQNLAVELNADNSDAIANLFVTLPAGTSISSVGGTLVTQLDSENQSAIANLLDIKTATNPPSSSSQPKVKESIGVVHQWDGTELRLLGPDGWGDFVDLRGEPGEPGFDGENGRDGYDGTDGQDAGIPDHQVDGNKIRFQKPNGDWGEWINLQEAIASNPKTVLALTPQHPLYERTKVGQWQHAKLLNFCQGYLLYRTIGEKLLNLRGNITLTKDLWANALIAEISNDKAKPINYGIEGEKLIKISVPVAIKNDVRVMDVDSKGMISLRTKAFANQVISIDTIIGR